MPNKDSAPPEGPARTAREGAIYKFGPFCLDPLERVLKKEDAPVSLTPKAFDTLLLLTQNSGHLLGKDELMEAIWPDTFVEEKTLAQNIFILRRALGHDTEGRHYIETVPKRGYRFRAAVEVLPRLGSDARGRGDELAAELVEASAGSWRDASSAATDEAASAEAEADDFAPTHRVAAETSVHNLAPASRARRLGWRAALATAVVAALLISTLWAASRVLERGRSRMDGVALREVAVTRLTDAGNIASLDLSPDGRHVVYAAAKGGLQSLHFRHVGAPSDVEILAPAPVEFWGLTFSRDGAWVFYVAREKGGPLGVLHRIPALGGTPTEILSDVDGPVAFSPKGDRVAFVRVLPERRETALLIANADGSGERRLATRPADDGFSLGGPSWSPDGRVIVSGTHSYGGGGPGQNLVAVELADGSMRPLAVGSWGWVGRASWLADGSGVLFTASDGDSEILSDQVWLVSYPGGQVRRVTQDVAGFQSLGCSEDAKVLAVARRDQVSGFWVAPKGEWSRAERITHGFGDPGSARLGLSWTPDARLLYAAGRNGRQNLWVMSPDGTGRRQLTFDFGAAFHPAASPDGRFIVFVSHREGRRQLWRMDSGGGGAVALTNSGGDDSPSISPDGRWVVYATEAEGRQTVWRVPSGGGEPVQLTRGASLAPVVSPDGKSIACLLRDEATGRWVSSLISFEDGRVIRQFPPKFPVSDPNMKWTPDGRFITYVVTRDGVSNIWGQPVEGGDPKQLTAWTSDVIYRFDWFSDGSLACERGSTVTDVILIRDSGGE